MSSFENISHLVKELCRPGGELEWVEFKQDNTAPPQIGEYISALANGAAMNDQPYGYLFWGVADGSGEATGTAFDPWNAKKGNEPLESWLSRSLDPKVFFQFHTADVNGKRIVLLKIESAMHAPIKFEGSAFFRVGSIKKRLKDEVERERKLWRKFDREPFERKVAFEALSVEDVLSLLNYHVYFSRLNRSVPTHRNIIIDAMSQDGLIRKNFGDRWDILNIGAILLARNLDKFPTLKRKAVRVIQYSDIGRQMALREQIGKKGYAVGFEGLINYINTLLPSKEVIGKTERSTVSTYPDIAVRELVVNMLIHQDFLMTGAGPMVEIFSDRVEITNPGEPLVSINRFVDAAPSSRNEGIASLMRRFRLCEERGSGIDKVISIIEVLQMPAPLFEIPPGATRCVLFSPRELKKMDVSDRVRAVYLHACLRYVMRQKTTNASLRERFGIEPQNAAVVSRLLNEAVDAGMIAVEDLTVGTRSYAYLPFWAAPAPNGEG